MTKVEELELRVAQLTADVRWLKSQLSADKPIAYNSPGSNPCSEIIQPRDFSFSVESGYRDEQQRWRDAGWNAYNSDYVDEFPSW